MSTSLFEHGLREQLEARLGRPVDLVLTDNTRSMISVRRTGRAYSLRLHHMFLEADEAVLDDLARFIRNGRSRLINAFIKAHTDTIRATPRRKTKITVKGAYYNLKTLFDEVNRDHFGSEVACRITWGRQRERRRKRSIMFGSYTPDADLIRINPRLDKPDIPDCFIRYIVFHEMLHAAMRTNEGCRHNKAFRTCERSYSGYKQAVSWQKANLKLFMR